MSFFTHPRFYHSDFISGFRRFATRPPDVYRCVGRRPHSTNLRGQAAIPGLVAVFLVCVGWVGGWRLPWADWSARKASERPLALGAGPRRENFSRTVRGTEGGAHGEREREGPCGRRADGRREGPAYDVSGEGAGNCFAKPCSITSYRCRWEVKAKCRKWERRLSHNARLLPNFCQTARNSGQHSC